VHTSPCPAGLVKDFNTGKAWEDQVKPFNFLVAFQVSSTAHATAKLGREPGA